MKTMMRTWMMKTIPTQSPPRSQARRNPPRANRLPRSQARRKPPSLQRRLLLAYLSRLELRQQRRAVLLSRVPFKSLSRLFRTTCALPSFSNLNMRPWTLTVLPSMTTSDERICERYFPLRYPAVDMIRRHFMISRYPSRRL